MFRSLDHPQGAQLFLAKVIFLKHSQIKSDVWLTVHRNSVWIKKTN